jgi:hypothetical protein
MNQEEKRAFFLEMINIEGTAEGARKAFETMIGGIIGQIFSDDGEKAVEATTKAFSVLRERLPSLLDAMVDSRTETYTDEEVVAMMEFYRSPVGKGILAKHATAYDKGTAIGKAWSEEHSPDIIGAIAKVAGIAYP